MHDCRNQRKQRVQNPCIYIIKDCEEVDVGKRWGGTVRSRGRGNLHENILHEVKKNLFSTQEKRSFNEKQFKESLCGITIMFCIIHNRNGIFQITNEALKVP